MMEQPQCHLVSELKKKDFHFLFGLLFLEISGRDAWTKPSPTKRKHHVIFIVILWCGCFACLFYKNFTPTVEMPLSSIVQVILWLILCSEVKWYTLLMLQWDLTKMWLLLVIFN
jgi:hypothetical protein